MALSKEDAAVHVETSIFDPSPSKMRVLESYVHQQCRDGTYDMAVNNYIMKMYRLNPRIAKEAIIELLLAKSLMNMPLTDWSTLRCLIPTKFRTKPRIRALGIMGECLDSGDFAEFWTKVAENREWLVRGGQLTDFEQSVRLYICRCVADTFESLDLNLLADLLNVGVDKVQRVLNDELNLQGWTVTEREIEVDGGKKETRKIVVVNTEDSVRKDKSKLGEPPVFGSIDQITNILSALV